MRGQCHTAAGLSLSALVRLSGSLCVCGGNATPLRGVQPLRFPQALRVALRLRGVQPHRTLLARGSMALGRPDTPLRGCLWSLGRGASALPCCCGFPSPSEVASLSAFRLLQLPAHGGFEQKAARGVVLIYIYTYLFASARRILCAEQSFLLQLLGSSCACASPTLRPRRGHLALRLCSSCACAAPMLRPRRGHFVPS